KRDGAAAGSRLPRRARPARALEGHLSRPGLSRLHDGNAGPERPQALAAGPVLSVPVAAPPHPALDLAPRPHRRAGPPGTRPAAGGGGSRAGGRLLLRARERGRAARLLPTRQVLGG